MRFAGNTDRMLPVCCRVASSRMLGSPAAAENDEQDAGRNHGADYRGQRDRVLLFGGRFERTYVDDLFTPRMIGTTPMISAVRISVSPSEERDFAFLRD
jgi:hypothetical protein